MENRVKDGNYYVVQSFMVKELGLKGLEKDVYAIIYGFSQAENQTFTGSLQYLADWTNSSKQGILKVLNSLMDKGLICKKENVINNVKFVEYYTTEFNGGMQQSLTDSSKQSLTNNINTNNNINNNIKRFTPPTLEEVSSYCEERQNGVDAQRFIDFYASKGWKVGNQSMKDWKACVRTWERQENKETSTKRIKPNYETRTYTEEEINSLFTNLDDVEL